MTTHTIQRILFLLLITLTASGCAVKYDNVAMNGYDSRPVLTKSSPKLQQSINGLTAALQSMSPSIDPREAQEVAQDGHTYPMHLANQWGLTWPPLWHNTLRNAKKRNAGLCTDWTKAMIDHTRAKNLKTMDIYWGVAFKGNAWREHSTMIVTPKGQPMERGIVMDPWRNSGELFWIYVNKDQKYPWKYYAGPFKYRAKQYTDLVPEKALIVN